MADGQPIFERTAYVESASDKFTLKLRMGYICRF